MKTLTLLLILIIIPSIVSSQRRVQIAGSRASIVIPDGTIISKHHSALTKIDDFEMSVVEFNGNLESKFREIDSAAYAQRGMHVYEEYNMTVDGYTGKIIHAYSDPAANVVQFLFGDNTFFIMVSTMYGEFNKKKYNEILNYYKTIKVDESKKINWNDFIAITYDKSSPIQLEKESINPFAILFRNRFDIKDSTKTYIMVQQYPNLGMFESLETFASQIIGNTIFKSYDIDEFISEGKSTMNGKAVYDFKAFCINKKGERQLVRCTARLTDELGVVVCAVVTEEKDKSDVDDFFSAMEFKN